MTKRIHIIVGDAAAAPLQAAMSQDEQLEAELFILNDSLHLGPLKTSGQSFSEGRTAFWQSLQPEQIASREIDDLERLMQLSTRITNGEELELWFWMAANPADVTAYYWILHYLKKHQGKLAVLNAIGLPFLDENGKLLYAENWSLLAPKEFIKARKLVRTISLSEWETDGEEWSRLVEQNAGIRLLDGGKNLKSADISMYDKSLLLYCKSGFQKGSRIVQQAISKQAIPTGEHFLLGRLNALTSAGILDRNKQEFRLSEKEGKVMQDQDLAAEDDELPSP